MKKNISIKTTNHSVELITNGLNEFNNVVLCFHGFNGDKWGDAFSGLKSILTNSLVVSFDSCGHGDSEVSSLDMRLDIILNEFHEIVKFLKHEAPNKPIILVAVSYGAYLVMQYLIKYQPKIEKVIYVNPAFKILEILEKTKNFRYSELKDDDLVVMKSSANKFMKKAFLDDLFINNLYTQTGSINYDSHVVLGTRDSLIPPEDTIEISEKYNLAITYIDEEHCFENRDSWQFIVDIIGGKY